jgi:UDP-3-O-[3-hydroxymyristoyl] glucosamine N-acyltransferase
MSSEKLYLSFDQVLDVGRASCVNKDVEAGVVFSLENLCRDLSKACSDSLCFFDKNHACDLAKTTSAGFCLITQECAHFLPEKVVPLITQHPYRSFVAVLRALCPEKTWHPQIHSSAYVEKGAHIHTSCFVGPGSFISKDAVIGSGCWIGPGAIVGPGVHMGENVTIHARACVEKTTIGSGSIVHVGACIGKTGFGFVVDEKGLLDIPHMGRVVLGKNVHVGAHTVIDRGSFQDTSVGDNTRIDSLVQIGHNVTIGSNVILAAQCGLSGSCTIEDQCILGGQTGVANKVILRKGTVIAAKSGVMKSSQPGDQLAGIPAMPVRAWHKHFLWMTKKYS